jgi:hypothetical protein
VILALLVSDGVVTATSLGPVLTVIAGLVILEIAYPMRHIRIVELNPHHTTDSP